MNRMKTKKILFVLLLSLCLLASCVSQQRPKPQKTNLIEQYITTGESYESQGRLQKALAQYELALTVDTDNRSALDHKKKVEAALYEIARQHYEKGLAFDEQGLYDEARRHYLSALQNWPEYTQAKERLSPGGVPLDSRDYILHTLLDGQSVSKLSLIYYGDLKYYPIIGKFNNMADVTLVRAGDKIKIPALNGLTVEDLQKRYNAYMIERQKKRGEQTGPSQSEVVAPKEPAAPLEPIELLQKSDSLEAPGNNDTAQTSEPSKATETSDAVEAPPSPEKPEAVPAEERTPDPPVATPANYEQAITLFRQKKYGQAIPLFKKAQAEDPDNRQIGANLFESYFQQGLTQFNKEQYLDARQSFLSAMQYNEDACDQCRTYIRTCENTYKEKHYNLGILYFGKEQLEQAINEWKHVEKIDPGFKDVQSNLKKAQTLYERLERIKQSNTK